MDAFAEIDGIFPSCLAADFFHIVRLLQFQHSRFVSEEVFSRLHHLDSQSGAFVRTDGTGDQPDRFV